MKHKVTGTMLIERDDVELEVELDGMYHPATPDVWYLSNGDPGYPGDPEEVTDITATLNGEEIELTDQEYERAESLLMDWRCSLA